MKTPKLKDLQGKCGLCRYADMGKDSRMDNLPFCRRYPAQLVQFNNQIQALFPVVDLQKDWCGEYAILESSLRVLPSSV